VRPETKISQQFIESYHTALELGLPKLLVKNKVKFYDTVKTANIIDDQHRPSGGNNGNFSDEENKFDFDTNFQGNFTYLTDSSFIFGLILFFFFIRFL